MGIGAESERLFAARGDSEYGGEAVSQREHALQAAAAAVADFLPLLARVALPHDCGRGQPPSTRLVIAGRQNSRLRR